MVLLTITSEGKHLKFLRCFLLFSDMRGAQLQLISIYTFIRTCKAQQPQLTSCRHCVKSCKKEPPSLWCGAVGKWSRRHLEAIKLESLGNHRLGMFYPYHSRAICFYSSTNEGYPIISTVTSTTQMISPPTGVIAVAAHGSKKESFISTEGALISTKGALRRPLTYDNHPSQSHPSIHIEH